MEFGTSTRTRFAPRERDADPLVIETQRKAAELLDDHKVMIPDFPLQGVRYLDFYRTFDRNPAVRAAALDCLEARYADHDIDAIAGVGGGGFGLGACLAHALGIPFHPIRKASDTVYDALSTSVGMVYAERQLTLASDIVTENEKVVLVDDTVATGGTSLGALDLLRRAGADVVEVATLFETTSKDGRNALAPTPLFAILSRAHF
ncbi:phosphoribosyltransferase family protein [Streptomyces sp. NPDC093089]|uniref:phosphoribosyltransferase family protein n=1 Tax=Streptomyces sp. NPDC093089 TaxID=3366024 RepID=UPI0037FCFA5F